MSAELRGIIEAYSAVYDNNVKEKLDSNRDEITEMDLTLITDEELSEIAESVLQELFEEGYSLFGAEVIFEDFISEARVTYGSDTQSPRAQKINRIKGAVRGTMNRAKETASSGAEKAFGKYRMAKDRLGKKITSTADTIKKTPGRVTTATKNTAERAKSKVKSGLKSMVRRAADRVASGASKVAKRMSEGKDPSYLETNMKERQANNEKARKDMKKMGSMENPAFGSGPAGSMRSEEVSKIRKDWGDAYASIYEKKMSKEDRKKAAKAGKRWQDSDGDGKWYEPGEDVKEDAHMKKGECENCGGKGCEKCEGMKEAIDPKGAARMDATKGKNKETQDEINKRLMLGKYSPAVKYAKMKEEVQFSEAELEAIQAKVDSWED